MEDWIGLPDGFIPTKEIGFVYLITNKDTGMKYIGKKCFWSMSKGERKESDWRKYKSSSKAVKTWKNIERKVLRVCHSQFELSYVEIECIIKSDALRRSDFCNYLIGREPIGRCPNYMMVK